MVFCGEWSASVIHGVGGDLDYALQTNRREREDGTITERKGIWNSFGSLEDLVSSVSSLILPNSRFFVWKMRGGPGMLY